MSLQAIFDPMVRAHFKKKYGGGGGNTGGGENPLDYAICLYETFKNVAFPSGAELELSFGNKIPSLSTTGFTEAFNGAAGLKSIKLSSSASFTQAVNCRKAFYGTDDTTLERIDLSGMSQPILVQNMSETFRNRKGLREVLGEFDLTNCTSAANAFVVCPALETVRFTAGTIKTYINFPGCALLTDETIQNIIDGLADLTGGTTQTLILHPTVGAKLTDAQKAAASAKNWTISY